MSVVTLRRPRNLRRIRDLGFKGFEDIGRQRHVEVAWNAQHRPNVVTSRWGIKTALGLVAIVDRITGGKLIVVSAAANVVGDFNDPSQRPIDRSGVRERLANVRIELYESACLSESCVVFTAHCPRSSKIGFRDVAGVDLVPVPDWRRFACKLGGISGVNDCDPVFRVWSHGAPR
jgi:hypothetical protein